MREEVQWFAERLEDTLRNNDHKGGWDNCTWSYLVSQLEGEIKELMDALPRNWYMCGRDRSGVDPEEVIKEATDVAAYAMMIADLARKG